MAGLLLKQECKMQTYQEEFIKAAQKCAQYIYNNDDVRKQYNLDIAFGHNPRDNVYYYAAYILNKDEELDIDIEEYMDKKDENIQK